MATSSRAPSLWLGIAARCTGDGSYVTQDPRQALTAAPYALHSLSTGVLPGYPVAATAPTANQVLKWDGSAWAASAGDDTTRTR